MMTKTFLAMGALNAFLAVALGAFGAHSLHDTLVRNNTLATYDTAAHYHLTHALGLILVALLPERLVPSARARLVAILLTVGIVFFSGSLYLLAITGTRILGAITPLGGLCFLSAWLTLAYSAWKSEM